jgi:hypothetical protein
MEVDLMPALGDLQQALQADGADMQVEGLDAGVATIRLILGPDACLDCIMPKDVLEKILLASIRKSKPDVTAVTLIDPRIDAQP